MKITKRQLRKIIRETVGGRPQLPPLDPYYEEGFADGEQGEPSPRYAAHDLDKRQYDSYMDGYYDGIEEYQSRRTTPRTMPVMSLQEVYYDSLKPVENYRDADDLIGQRLWAHTNRTHRNQKRNGMIGLYGTTDKGTKTGSPLFYTNALRLTSPIVFQVSESGAERIARLHRETGKPSRTLVAGVSGVVTKTNEGQSLSGFQEVIFNPFAENKFFHVANNPDVPIVTADEVFFQATESTALGEPRENYVFMVKNPRGADEI
jgi:hypothetical protein